MSNIAKSLLAIISLIFILALFLWGLGDALIPLIFSFILVYLLFPVVKKLERKGVNRNTSMVILFGVTLLIIVLFLVLTLPKLINESHDFIKELPTNSTKAIQKVESLVESLGYDLNLSKDKVQSFFKSHISEVSSSLLKNVGKALESSFSGISSILISILNFFLIPLFFFYIINDYEKITKKLKDLIPNAAHSKINHYLKLGNKVLSGYIRGQLLVAATLSVLYALGLSLVGLKFSILIGLLSGLICIIPYAGFVIGFGTALVIGLANYDGIGTIMGIVLVYTLVQGVEGTIITPKLVGDKVGLSAFATVLALIIGGNIFGLAGMIIAIPIAAILKSIIKELITEYRESSFYQQNQS